MSASPSTVEIRITAANMADPAFQALISDLKQTGSAAQVASGEVEAAGRSAAGAGAGFRTAASEVQAVQTPIAGTRSGLASLGQSFGSVGQIAAGFTLSTALMKAPGLFLDMAKAAGDDAASTAMLKQAVENTGVSWDNYSKQINAAITHGQSLAFTDDQVRTALSLLAAETGSTEQALLRLHTAMDLSRGTGMDLATSARLLGKVTDDNVTALQRYGVAVQKGADAQTLLNAVDQKFGGQAGVYAASEAGELQKASQAAGELEEALGRGLAPTVTTVAAIVSAGTVEITKLADASPIVAAGMQAIGAAAGGVLVLGLGAAAVAATTAATAFVGLDAAALPWIGLAAAVGVGALAAAYDYEQLKSRIDAAKDSQTQYNTVLHDTSTSNLNYVDAANGVSYVVSNSAATFNQAAAAATRMTGTLVTAQDVAKGYKITQQGITLDLSQYLIQAAQGVYTIQSMTTAQAAWSDAVGRVQAPLRAVLGLLDQQNEKSASLAQAAGAMDAEAQAGERLNAALQGLNDSSYHLKSAQEELAQAYQIGLTVQSTYTSQSSEYSSQIDTIKKGLEAWKTQLDNGEISQDTYNKKVEEANVALGRLQGGQVDATATAADYAVANGLLMKAQDDVNKQYPSLVAGSEEYNQKLKEAFINAGGTAEAFDTMQASGGGLQAAIAGPGGLTEAVNNLIKALQDAGNQHPEPTVNVKTTGKGDLDAIAATLQGLDGKTYYATVNIGTSGVGFAGAGGGSPFVPDPGNQTIGGDSGGGGVGPNAQGRNLQSIGDAFGGAVITPAMVQSARQQTSNATSYANEIKALVQALADAAAVMGDGVTVAKDYADAAKTVVDVYSAAVDLNDKMGATVYAFGDQQAANIAALKFLTEKAVNSLGDSAALWSSDGLAHVKEYADAAKSSLDVISQALQFVKDMGQTVVLYGGWQDQNIANLKFIAEKAVTSIADSANIMNGPYIAGVKSYADAAQGALATLSAALQLVKDLGDTVVLYGALQDTNLANLKFIAEKAVTSLADSAAVANGPAVAAAKDYADSAGAVLGVMSDALQLVKDLGDTVVNYGDYQRTALSNLKFIAEWATRAIADSAAVMQGPYLAGVKDYADAVGAAIGAEKDALDLVQALADDTALSSINMRQVAMNARTLAGDARLAVDAFGAAAAGYAAVDPSITALSGDVSTSISALKDTVDFLSTLSNWTDDAHVSGRYVIDSARALGGDARMIADAFDAAAAGYGTEVNASVKALSDDVQSTLGALSDTLDFMGKLADFKPPSAADISAFATEIAADTVLFVQDLQDASKDMNTDAVKAAGEWADGAGKVLTLMGTTADALVKINAVGRITAAQMQVFHDDVEQVFQLIPQLWTDVQPFIDDAANLQPVLEQIAADMQAAQSAVNGLNVGGGGGGGGSSSGGSGGGGGGGFTPGGALGAKHGGAYGQQIGVLGPSGVPGYGRPDPQPLNVHVHMQIAQHEFEQVVTTTLDGIDRRRF